MSPPASPDLRPLEAGDLDEAWAMGLLAFGGDPATPRPDAPEREQWGAFGDDGRLLATATLLAYGQWFGGRPVPMAGLAGVATRADVRGRGLVRTLVRALVPVMRERGLPVSTLFATAPGIYRELGWELAGALEDTVLPVADLARVTADDAVQLRPAGPADAPVLQELWDEHGRTGNGALTRTGAHFPDGALRVLRADVVTLAESGGAPVGYVAYDRGTGYGVDAELRVHELVAVTASAHRALLSSLGRWDSVVGTVSFRGPTEDLARLLPRAVPPPVRSRPWSLRLVDPVAAVAARGWPVDADVSFALIDPEAPEVVSGRRLQVSRGAGVLSSCEGTGLPQLHVRGLAVLYAGGTDSAALVRTGLLDRPCPALDLAFSGPRPSLLDYF